MKKLPKEFKKKWVNALRSGKYKQGEGNLFCNGAYCCMGVACKIERMPDGYIELTGFIRPYMALARRIPEVLIKSETNSQIPNALADLNDDGVPFEVIAGVIDQWL